MFVIDHSSPSSRTKFSKIRSLVNSLGLKYSIFVEGTNKLPLKGKPLVKSIDELSADTGSFVFIQKGNEAVYNRYGQQTNLVVVPNHYVRELARLALRNIYDNDPDQTRRREAGEGLGYSIFRINSHESRLARS